MKAFAQECPERFSFQQSETQTIQRTFHTVEYDLSITQEDCSGGPPRSIGQEGHPGALPRSTQERNTNTCNNSAGSQGCTEQDPAKPQTSFAVGTHEQNILDMAKISGGKWAVARAEVPWRVTGRSSLGWSGSGSVTLKVMCHQVSENSTHLVPVLDSQSQQWVIDFVQLRRVVSGVTAGDLNKGDSGPWYHICNFLWIYSYFKIKKFKSDDYRS